MGDKLSITVDALEFKYFQIRPDIMARLVEDEVYKAVHIVDYQAVCFREKKTTNPATMLFTVIHLLNILLCRFHCHTDAMPDIECKL